MTEAAVFSYFYFMDEYLSILSPSKEAHLPPSFVTLKKNRVLFPHII